MSDLRYWIISVPAKSGNKEAVFSRIQRCSAEFIENGTASRFLVPGGLRVGTLDSLMSMSDELVKIDHMVEHTARKIGQQIYSLKDKKPESGSIFLTINGTTLPDYIKQFQWNPAKFSLRLSVQELTNRFQEQVSGIEEEYRQKMMDYSNIAHAVTQYERSLKANLTVRDLTDIVDVDDIIESEFLTTLFVVCNKQQEKDWEAVYESFSTDPERSASESQGGRPSVIEYVVPGSLKRVSEEGDQCLLCVTLLKSFKELFKQEASKHHVTVREVKIDKENYKSGNEKYQEMKKEMKEKQSKLFQWCQANFTEVFVAWTHLKCLRVHVESILRFGLPPEFVAAVLKPVKISQEKKT
mmetsp:Transcript_38665/g.66381  ORF Transcript_38665/g.66381 Transcript_38665/m.66381 type:complete len:354 (-) Transcript_38665:225-1286(-)